MGSKAWFEVVRWAYDDPEWHCQVSLSNGLYTVRQEVYVHPPQLSAFGEGLRSFPRSLQDEVIFEAGGRGEEWAHWVFLRAHVVDRTGGTALLFRACHRGGDPWQSEARFTTFSEAAALNRLGAALSGWHPEEEGVLHVEL